MELGIFLPNVHPSARATPDKTRQKIDIFFASFPFSKEMVLLYCYTDIYSRPQLVEKVHLDGVTLEIEFSLKKPKTGVKDASMPGCKQLIIKMDALEIETAKFVKK